MYNVAYLRFISITSGRYCLAPASLRSFGDGKKKKKKSVPLRRSGVVLIEGTVSFV